MSIGRSLLLHICCGPDATVPVPDLLTEGFDVTGFFYGGNIHPRREFDLRRTAVERVSAEWGVETIIPGYDPIPWFREVLLRGLSDEKEGGLRCSLCFRLQFREAARMASSMGFDFMTTTLTISPHKNPLEVNSIGKEEAGLAGVGWIDRVWRKKEGFKRSIAESGRLGLYRQTYCGCIYSARNRDDRT